MFKALFLDSHNLMPKIVPRGIKSIEFIHNFMPKIVPQGIKSIKFIQGDGGAGSIKQTNFAEGGHLKYLKHRIDAIDVENLVCKYTLIEGDVVSDKIEYVAYEVKFEASSDGGCVCKMTSEYHTKVGAELKEEDIKQGKDKAMALYKVVEDYLSANPVVYA